MSGAMVTDSCSLPLLQNTYLTHYLLLLFSAFFIYAVCKIHDKPTRKATILVCDPINHLSKLTELIGVAKDGQIIKNAAKFVFDCFLKWQATWFRKMICTAKKVYYTNYVTVTQQLPYCLYLHIILYWQKVFRSALDKNKEEVHNTSHSCC